MNYETDAETVIYTPHFDSKKILSAAAVLGILVFMWLFPAGNIGLSRSGALTLGLLIATIATIVTELLPIGLTCFLSISMMILLKIVPAPSDAFSGFTNHAIYFVMISFGLSSAFSKTPLANRLIAFLTRIFGSKPTHILFAFMISAAILSSVASNVATIILFIDITIPFLSVYKNEHDKKMSGKSFMIGLPIAAVFGGMMTPAGNAANLLIIEYLVHTGVNINFLQWMGMGIPIGLFGVVLAWLIITKVYPPVALDEAEIEEHLSFNDMPAKISRSEKYVLVVFMAMFILWIAGTWIPFLQVTAVAIVGLACLCIPNIGVIKWNDYLNTINLTPIILLGTMLTFGNCLFKNGVSEWIVTTVLPAALPGSVYVVVLLIGMCVSMLLVPIPIAPALIAMMSPSLLLLAKEWGINAAYVLIPLLLSAVNSFHLPLDAVPIMTYLTGYYKMGEMAKVGIPIEIIFNCVMAAFIPFILGLMNIV